MKKSKHVHVMFSCVQRENKLLLQGLLVFNSEDQDYSEALIVEIWRQIYCLH